MTDGGVHPAVARVVRDHDGDGLLAALGGRMSGSDLTTLLLEVAQRRVAAITPADVLAQYERDRFVRPSAVDPRRLLELELLALDAVAHSFLPIATSPLVPFGAHSVFAGVHQNRVVTTTRGSEVAADPTNTLALEAAVRRRVLLAADPRSNTVVHLAAVDRVVRAQQFDGARSFAHFTLLGLVSAGRDTGGHSFERSALRRHLQALVSMVQRAGFGNVLVRLTDFGGRHQEVIDELISDANSDHVSIALWPERTAAKGYYQGVCLKLCVLADGEEVEVADGGFVEWTQSLVGSRKERLMISGLSLERLAVVGDEIG
ncbi:MAG: hypothetical protein WCC60_09160 [Ilumatobacteraceae bacterium]